MQYSTTMIMLFITPVLKYMYLTKTILVPKFAFKVLVGHDILFYLIIDEKLQGATHTHTRTHAHAQINEKDTNQHY